MQIGTHLPWDFETALILNYILVILMSRDGLLASTVLRYSSTLTKILDLASDLELVRGA